MADQWVLWAEHRRVDSHLKPCTPCAIEANAVIGATALSSSNDWRFPSYPYEGVRVVSVGG